jgi:hypothetical protein
MRLFSYRDKLEEQRYSYWGVTLYFVIGKPEEQPGNISGIFGIIEAIAGHITENRRFDVGRAIEKLFQRSDPVLEFLRMCIQSGVPKTRCYFDARTSGLKIRKQTALALYEYLKLEQEITEPHKGNIPPSSAFFEKVQDYFVDALADDDYFQQFSYLRSDLSECDVSDISTTDERNLKDGDFVFEIGELDSARFLYYGHFNGRKFTTLKLYDAFPITGLVRLLQRRK